MGFGQTIACGLTVAVFMGLAGLWYKDQSIFHPVGRTLLIVLFAVFVACSVFTVAYQLGASATYLRDEQTISEMRQKLWQVRMEEAKKGQQQTDNEAAMFQAIPVTLDSPGLYQTLFVIPDWFWICLMLLILELAVLTGVRYSRREPPNN
jgi:hypothetical protein